MLKFGKAGSKNVTPLTSRAGSPDPRSNDAVDKGNASIGITAVGNVPGGQVPGANPPATGESAHPLSCTQMLHPLT